VSESICICEQHGDGRTWVRECHQHGIEAIKAKLVPVGTRIRHVRHHDLTGHIKALEYTSPGELSPIPYLIGWDNSSLAADRLGWFFVYSGPESVERIPEVVP
jgi:hypothetical protein